ncbi:transmembrane protein 260 isoform X2 [Electrophorus electricus]|uniref:transmembrane protein 260 isoform X2 n=1 Tax=Electrophorus electricus TaxID=8005 RepID=UPI0015D0C133|nr:transmembrane protein 260 isoform X2 [Electrophorus electricus]
MGREPLPRHTALDYKATKGVEQSREPPPDRLSWTLTGATVACVTALYVPRVQRTAPGGDSGELITAACELGVAHPPGYPLFTMLASLVLHLLPATSPAHSVAVLCALLGGVASGALCYTVCRVAGPGPGAVLAGGSFAASRLVWKWSLVAEVFSLNNLFVGLLFALSACVHNAESVAHKRKLAQWGALCCGLGLCNQHTLVVYVLVIVPWALLQLSAPSVLSVWDVFGLGLWFSAGFLPYLYLPVSSYVNMARWSWGDQTTLAGLLTHLLRAEYGTFSLAKSEAGVSMAHMLQAHLNHCVADLSLPVLALAGVALLQASWKRRRCSLVWLIAVMVSLYSVFFAWRANLDIETPLLLGVVERFWLQADAGMCVLAGVGLGWSVSWLQRRLAGGAVWTAGAWLLTAGLLSHMIHSNHRECDQSSNDVVEKFAREVALSFPEDSLVLTRGDLPGNTLRYLHYCQALRPDLSLVDQEMMTYGWYVAKLRRHLPGVNFPGRLWNLDPAEDSDGFTIERFLQHNTHRPVFACIGLSEGDPSWERTFSRWPWGVCEQLVPVTRRLHPEEWARSTQRLYNWRQPHDSFPLGSWERVANEEMWQARMKMPFFLFDLAERLEGSGQTRLYELSYDLYCQIVDAQADYPANWDKNLALAAERLLRLGGGRHRPGSLLSRSIHHFSRYVQREPADPQSGAIRSAIAHLSTERDRLRASERQTNTGRL